MEERTPEEIALERIDVAERKSFRTLDLRDIRLATLPAAIGRLTHLTSLLLRKHQLTTLPPEIGELTKLNFLELNYGKLRALPPEIGSLKQLKHLILGANELDALPSEFARLTNLQILDLQENRFISLPAEIEELEGLTQLYLSGNPFTVAPEEVIQKTSSLSHLTHLFFSKMPLMPEELNAEDWLWAMRRKRNLYGEAKIFFVGNRGVGKTSLFRQLIPRSPAPWAGKTQGVFFHRLHFQEQTEIPYNIWDFGGQELLQPLHQFFPTYPNLYILVVDASQTQKENRIEEWLSRLHSLSPDTPVLIVGNKMDLTSLFHPFRIHREGLLAHYPNLVDILETSAKTGLGLQAFTAEIATQINALTYLRPPKFYRNTYEPPNFDAWPHVRAQIERIGKTQNYLTYQEYVALCDRLRIRYPPSIDALISFLHDLGVILFFHDAPQLDAWIMLHPSRVIEGIYKILNAQELVENDRRMSSHNVDRLLEKARYDEIERKYLFNLMKKFNLCIETEDETTYFFPNVGN